MDPSYAFPFVPVVLTSTGQEVAAAQYPALSSAAVGGGGPLVAVTGQLSELGGSAVGLVGAGRHRRRSSCGACAERWLRALATPLPGPTPAACACLARPTSAPTHPDRCPAPRLPTHLPAVCGAPRHQLFEPG